MAEKIFGRHGGMVTPQQTPPLLLFALVLVVTMLTLRWLWNLYLYMFAATKMNDLTLLVHGVVLAVAWTIVHYEWQKRSQKP